MPLVDAGVSALLNLVVLAGIPFLAYFAYQRLRHRRRFLEVARRVGLQLGDARYVGYSLVVAAVGVAALIAWPPPLEPFLRDGSPQRPFVGLGLSGRAVAMALLYGLVKTGLAEEFLFRGLIAGSLARRWRLRWANLTQALIFLLPHLLVLTIMPEMGWVLPVILAGALFTGWARIKSGSILGPWLIHGSVNVTICLGVAARTCS